MTETLVDRDRLVFLALAALACVAVYVEFNAEAQQDKSQLSGNMVTDRTATAATLAPINAAPQSKQRGNGDESLDRSGPAVAAPMPPASPIFEARPLPLSSPLQCSGRRNQRGWIRHEGDRMRTAARCV